MITCNTDAKVVAAAWGTVMKNWSSSTLVSPATAGDGVSWFDEFFAACKQLYGAVIKKLHSHIQSARL